FEEISPTVCRAHELKRIELVADQTPEQIKMRFTDVGFEQARFPKRTGSMRQSQSSKIPKTHDHLHHRNGASDARRAFVQHILVATKILSEQRTKGHALKQIRPLHRRRGDIDHELPEARENLPQSLTIQLIDIR